MGRIPCSPDSSYLGTHFYQRHWLRTSLTKLQDLLKTLLLHARIRLRSWHTLIRGVIKTKKTTHIYMASSYICGIFICHHISMINSWKKNCGNSPLKLNIASEKRPSHAPKGSRIISKKLSIFRCKLAVRFGEGNPWNLWPKGPAADRRTRTGSRTGSSFVSLGFWNIPTVILSPCKTYIPMKRNFCTTWTYLYRYNINTYIYTDL